MPLTHAHLEMISGLDSHRIFLISDSMLINDILAQRSHVVIGESQGLISNLDSPTWGFLRA